ncbi:HTH_Tnp_Tc3_2 domain-containing protein [Trichonephila clavipes]|nr:HTH_Tnp_Tc3_2 domain-containing protein [Trichonephila clavipes]
MGHSISEIVRQPRFLRSTVSRVYQEYIDGGRKISDRANCRGQLALTVSGERQLRRIVCSQRSHTLAQITTQLNDGGSRTVSKQTVLGKRVVWSDESRFRLLNADGRLRIWRQAHEAMNPAYQVGTVQGHGFQSWSGVFFRSTVWDLWCVYQPPPMQFGVKGHHTEPTNLTEFWTALANIWQVIHVEHLRKLCLSLCLVVWQPLSRPEEAQLVTRSVVWTGKEEKEKWDDKKRVKNREGSLGYPGFVTPVFTKDSKPLGKRKRSLGHLGIVTPVLT